MVAVDSPVTVKSALRRWSHSIASTTGRGSHTAREATLAEDQAPEVFVLRTAYGCVASSLAHLRRASIVAYLPFQPGTRKGVHVHAVYMGAGTRALHNTFLDPGYFIVNDR